MSNKRATKELPVEKYVEFTRDGYNWSAIQRFVRYFPITPRRAAYLLYHRKKSTDVTNILYAIEERCGEYDRSGPDVSPVAYVQRLSGNAGVRYSTVRKFIERYRMTSIPLVDLRVKRPDEKRPLEEVPKEHAAGAFALDVINRVGKPNEPIRLTFSDVRLAVADLLDEDLATPLTIKIASRVLELIAAKYKERE